ncbi:MbnP family protein [uncultured Pontibacter sp.]|uniref:MbnP family protein n=1 Tax=uncultured Pontibacter sp. TaxID=453356 RepID=UPI00260B3186|nr:MbnP family protein [uncultured Pontibacter sp.]
MKALLSSAAKLLFTLALALPLASCSDDEDEPATGTVQVAVQHTVGSQGLQADETYTSPSGDSYMVQKLRFYLSNVKLISQDGRTVYTQPDSYHLITLDGKAGFSLDEVPAAVYTKMEFAIGVDEARNHSIDQFGDLDPSNDMVWDWTTGYKFLSLEGLYTGDTKNGGLVFHIGEDSNYKVFTLELPQPLDLRQRPTGNLRLVTDVNELFRNPHLIDFDELNTAMGGENARKIVENYSQGFIRIESGE